MRLLLSHVLRVYLRSPSFLELFFGIKMPKKSKKALVMQERAKKASVAKELARQSAKNEGDEATSGSGNHAVLSAVLATPPTPGPSSRDTTPIVSSSKKRKRLFISAEDEKTVVDREQFNVMMSSGDMKDIMKKVMCCECRTLPVCSFSNLGMGTDNKCTISCECDDSIFEMNSEIVHLRQSRKKYYSNTMKIVYSSMLEGLSHSAVQNGHESCEQKTVAEV